MTAHFHPECTADQDAFNRRTFAENLACGIAAPHRDGGLVVAIEGEWGSGKSSILGWIIEALEKQDSAPLVIQFNPWRISGQDTLTETFLTLLAAQIGGESNASNAEKGAAAGERILGYLKLLRHLKYLKYVPAAGWASELAGDVADYAENASKAGDAFVDDVRNTLAKDKGIEGLREGIDGALGELGREVVVVMDDLDRLTRDEIRTVFQLLKAVADFKHITYLLAFDPERVALSLADNGDKEEGRAFLEKIVQVAYPIPPLFPWQSARFAQKHLEQTLRDTGRELKPFEQDLWHSAVFEASLLARQPRDIVRLCNRLRISWPATSGAVNACDVMVYEALCQRFPDLATAIRLYPYEFTGQEYRAHESFSTFTQRGFFEQRTNCEQWEKHLPTNSKETMVAERACKFLFPYVRQQRMSDEAAHWRIANTETLERLLQGTTLEGVADAQDFHDYLTNPEMLTSLLANLERGQINTWLKYACQYTPGIDITDPSPVIRILAKDCKRWIEAGRASNSLCEQYGLLVSSIIEKQQPGGRSVLFMLAIDEAPLSMTHNLIYQAATECGLWIQRKHEITQPQYRLIQDEAAVEEGIAKWKARAQQASTEGSLALEPMLHHILYRWAQFGTALQYEPAWAAVAKLCANRKGLHAFMGGYVNNDNMFPHDINLVRNPDALLAIIEEHPDLKHIHSEFVARLSDPTARQELEALIKSQEQ